MTADLTSNAAPPPGRRMAGIAAGLALIAVLIVIDIHIGPNQVVIGMVVIGPFVTALLADVRETAAVGLVAIVALALSATWHHSVDAAYLIRLSGVTAGAVFAVLGAQARVRDIGARRRLELLAAIADVADGRLSLTAAVDRIAELLVPGLGDAVVIEGRHGGVPTPLATRGPEAAYAAGPDRTISVPLGARGRELGRLTLRLDPAGRRLYRPSDRRYAAVLSGRVALALDNAGLFSELESMEAQLTAALGSLSDAVTVQNADGRLVYVNDAAARSMGFADASEMLATPAAELIGRYEMYLEDGSLVPLEWLPGRRVLAGDPTPPPLTVRAVHRATGEERWQLIKASPVLDREGRPHLAVNVIEDITDIKKAEFGQRLLVQAGAALAASLDVERTLQQVADLAVPELADWCGVSLPEPSGELRQVAVAHVDPDKVRFAREYNRRFPVSVHDATGAAEVLRTGVSQLVTEIPDALLEAAVPDAEQRELLRSLGMRSVMIVPMVAAGRATGVLSFVSAESGRRFSEADLPLAEELGRRAGTAVQNARLYAERTHIARTLQTGLLPDAVPAIPGLSLATLYRPAGEENWVGGDFYDAFPVAGGWMVVVGDVAGRGPEAAALTALARHTLRTAATVGPDPMQALDHLNRELLARPVISLVTIACALIHRGAGGGATARIACAGHPPALLVRDREVSPLGRFGPMLGAFASSEWTPVEVELADGDLLVLYTDGVIDTHGEDGRFGEDRLHETVRTARDADDAVRRIDSALRDFEAGEQADDTAILAIRCGPGVAAAGARHRLDLPGGLSAPRRARRAVVSWFAGDLPPHLLYDLQVLVSELVTNAVRHAGAGEEHVIVLEAEASAELLRVAVTDPGGGFEAQHPPRPRPGGGGAGLVLVDRLASRWAAHPGPPSMVWFEVDRAAASAAA